VFAHQESATAGEGFAGPGLPFAKFESNEAGYFAFLKNLVANMRDQDMTLESYIRHYDKDANVETYLANAKKATGAASDTLLSNIDLDKLARFQLKQESQSTVSGNTLDILALIAQYKASQPPAEAQNVPPPKVAPRGDDTSYVRVAPTAYHPTRTAEDWNMAWANTRRPAAIERASYGPGEQRIDIGGVTITIMQPGADESQINRIVVDAIREALDRRTRSNISQLNPAWSV
jgi:hypothetical protein